MLFMTETPNSFCTHWSSGSFPNHSHGKEIYVNSQSSFSVCVCVSASELSTPSLKNSKQNLVLFGVEFYHFLPVTLKLYGLSPWIHSYKETFIIYWTTTASWNGTNSILMLLCILFYSMVWFANTWLSIFFFLRQNPGWSSTPCVA